MAVNKVIVAGQTKLDLTGDTVAADKLLSGYTAHNKAGNKVTGTYKPNGTYAWAKYTAKGGNLIGYVVSDNTAEYPNAQTSGSYYYEQLWEVELPATGWTASGDRYSQRINVAGMKASYAPSCTLSDKTSAADLEAISEAYSLLDEMYAYDGYIIAYMSEIPAVKFLVELRGG